MVSKQLQASLGVAASNRRTPQRTTSTNRSSTFSHTHPTPTGQKSIRPYWRNYFDNTDALVYVIDSSDRARMEEAGLELTKLLEEDKMQQVPLLVFANKQDLLNAMPADELIGALQLNNIKDREMQVTACSAKNDEGLQPGMEWLVATMNNAQGGGK